jgi:pilus assembly protein CpaE
MPDTILIVEDSPTAGPELRMLLEQQGYNVLLALRAEEALDMLRTAPVNLIITEALLPGMDGFDLVRQIRDHEGWESLPIIMLTVRSTPEDYAAGFEAGANEYFVKPQDPPKLLAAVRGLVKRHSAGKLAHPGPQTAAQHQRVRQGEIITVFSLKGGVGTTTLAVNLAVAVKRLVPSSRVGLVDLAFEQGHDALLLDIVPTSTILDWARSKTGDATPQVLNQYFVQHRSGINLLAAPLAPEDAEMVRPDTVRLTLSLAQQAFDHLIVDTSSTFSETTLIALEMASAIVVPLTADMGSLKSAVATKRILTAVRIPEDKIRFVLNGIIPRAGLSKDQIETSLQMSVFQIPHAGSTFMAAANQGMPATSAQNAPPAARAIVDLARTLCEPEEVEQVEQMPQGIRGRLFRGSRA